MMQYTVILRKNRRAAAYDKLTIFFDLDDTLYDRRIPI